jgi:hypothetical protein
MSRIDTVAAMRTGHRQAPGSAIVQRRQHAAVGAEGDFNDRLHCAVGLNDMAAAIGEECGSIEDAIEPCLIQQGCAQRTPRRRIAILSACRRLGAAPLAATSGDWFQA